MNRRQALAGIFGGVAALIALPTKAESIPVYPLSENDIAFGGARAPGKTNAFHDYVEQDVVKAWRDSSGNGRHLIMHFKAEDEFLIVGGGGSGGNAGPSSGGGSGGRFSDPFIIRR